MSRFANEPMPPPYPGTCLCGGINFQLIADPLTFYVGHCTMCQRRTDLQILEGDAPLAESDLYTRSKQPWFLIPPGVAQFETYPEKPSELVRLWRGGKRDGDVDACAGESYPTHWGMT